MKDAVQDFRHRAERADFVAVIDDEGRHTARELLARAEVLADVLGPRATALVQADNSWRTVVAALATGLTGGVLAVVNRHTTRAEFAAACEDIRPDVVVAEPSAMAEWDVATVRPGGTRPALDSWSAVSGAGREDPARWDGGVFIGLTSGSTGRAKGVVQSEEALRYACACTIEINGLRPGDAVAAIVPLSSTAAFCFGVHCALLLGGPLVLTAKWDPPSVVTRLAETGARWTMCVPTMALQLAAAGAVPGLRSITVGGGPMDRVALERAETALGTRILRVFGMSECLGHTSPSPSEPADVRLGHDGRPFPGTELRAVSAEGAVLGPGETGRAQVRGPSLFLGYARGGRVEPPELTGDGFFPTGDLIVSDVDGLVTIMGREKDVIIRGGRNLDVTEIERAVAGYERLAQACVVPVRDDVLGERVALLAVPRGDAPVELGDVTGYLRDAGLAKTKWPEFVYLVDALPQTKVGKLDRAGARELAEGLHTGVS
ncbi:class I adenylate-forming enzyme family protein [Amycolatopsis vancoresmycina]|uniref:AMP-dependent synthetase/ligase n=1 Tax=Amycolatopsis vancoresmycina DSM 44592 TaxID=1292037 RepID=R1I9X7_9PSEU|nr:class I adenylate-forming enzyme family protein [Amycolatopsis vancoresmycina]EOD67209.1 AMP-dependent synthetase/ligase [Amycolatopsis vancoresmycina DSM 44592]